MTKILFLLLTHCAYLSNAQSFWNSANLNYGEFKVGFKNYSKEDNTRTYLRISDWNGKILSRPMSISIWYPTDKGDSKSMIVKDYMAILKNEEEWERLPNDRILSWFYSDNEKNRRHFEIETKAYLNAPATKKKFPVLIYAPSYQASSTENFILCEFLASHGYVVISSPSRGTENRFLTGGTTKDIETQARDIEFLIGEISTIPYADENNFAVAGFSFGGISNVLAAMKNKKVKALICLDGSVKYQFNKLIASPYSDLSIDIPFIFMSQKDIPLQVMIEDKIDTTLNNTFHFYDTLTQSEAYYLKFHDLTHSYFSSMGILFQKRDPRQDKSDLEIISSYGWVSRYTLHFLNAYLKQGESSKQFLNNDPVRNGVKLNSISLNFKKPIERRFTFENFNKLAEKQDYKNLETLYKNLKDQNPDLQLEEWKFNNLGLQLLFKGKVQEGINILILNTKLYPNSANGFDSLAEGYLIQGNNELAIKNFEVSIKLDSQNQNAIDRLNILRKR